MPPRPSCWCLALQSRTESRGCWGWASFSPPHPLLAPAPAGRGCSARPTSNSCLSHGFAEGRNSPQLPSSRLRFMMCFMETKPHPCPAGKVQPQRRMSLPAHGTARHPCASCGAKRTPRCWGGGQNPEFPFANRGWDPVGPGYLLAGVAGDWPVVVQGPTYQCRMLPCSSRAFLPSRLLITMSCLHLKRRFPAIVLQDLQLDAKRSAYQPPPQHRGKAKAPLPSPAKLPGNHVGLINCCLARGVAVEIAICSEFRQLRRNRDSSCPQAENPGSEAVPWGMWLLCPLSSVLCPQCADFGLFPQRKA